MEIASVTADGACDTRKCQDAVVGRGAHAVILPCKNAKPRRRKRQVRSHASRHGERQDASEARYGDDGAATSAGAVQSVGNCCVSA